MTTVHVAEFIKQLRSELQEAMAAGDGAELRFKAEAIDLELAITVEESAGKKGDLNFKVLGVGFGGGGSTAEKSAIVQKLKLSLKPVGEDGSSPYIANNKGGGFS